MRQQAAFAAAPYDAFLTPGADKEAFGADLVASKDITPVPGQRYEVLEQVGREAGYVGVVALYHSPAPGRWRLAFDAAQAEKAGLTVGMQACALSVGTGAQPTDSNVNDLGSARCQ
ncbi:MULTISPECIES: type VI secretion system lipoprotein TssJ [unclassified Massilia]|uniref:type VI secretion system lipoprotein TssJ n=1 Tax=unclassified Massilia TaxID=2609279 RepID=UPI001E3067F7|nr:MULTISPECIES: type VI secretion system lipoprotein TssJ [unclassified Massilia]